MNADKSTSNTSHQKQSELEGQSFAAIDLGSNSFHMLVARYEHGTLQIIDRIKDMVRLAAGVNEHGKLDPVYQKAALEALARFGDRIREIPKENVRVVGTNAMRKMRDGNQFIAHAEQALGASIEIISGREEARLVYLGVAHGISEAGQQRLVIDIGGGSTEFVIGKDFEPVALESLYFGCVGISQKFFSDGKITKGRWRKARNAVMSELQRISDDFCDIGWQQAIGSSGTMRAVRDVVVNRGWSERGINPEAMRELRSYLIDRGQVEKIALDGLSDRRQPVFAGGAVIVDACLKLLEIDSMIVADYALREGLLYDMIGRMLQDDPREAAVEAMLEKYRIDRVQANRVAKTALDLYGQASLEWSYPESSKNWLRWSAELHELGLAIALHGHDRHGAYIIEHSDMAGFSRLEQAILAALIKNHRGKPGRDALDQLLPRVQKDTEQTTILLRLAVLMHRSRRSGPTPEIILNAQNRSYELRFPPDFLTQHPLVDADLEYEANQLKKWDVDLTYS